MTDKSGSDQEGPTQKMTRRRLLAGGLVLTGGLSALVDGGTSALFTSSQSATGAVQVDAAPNLNYLISDQTQYTNVAYSVSFQVEWVKNFDRIEIGIENTTDGDHSATYTQYSESGTISYPKNGNGDGRDAGDTYEFTFEVYESGASTPVIDKTVTDTADGNDSGEGDFGSTDDPKLERITVTDTTKNTNVEYTVEYEVSNTQNFQSAEITFDGRNGASWDRKTVTKTGSPTGTASYRQGFKNVPTFDIAVEVTNTDGLVVDSHTVTDDPDGNDTEWTA